MYVLHDPRDFLYTDANLYDWRDNDDYELEMVIYGGSLGSWLKSNASRAVHSPFAKKMWEGYKTFIAPAVKDFAKQYLPDEVVDKAEAKGKAFIASDNKKKFAKEAFKGIQPEKQAYAFAGDVGARIIADKLRKYGYTGTPHEFNTVSNEFVPYVAY